MLYPQGNHDEDRRQHRVYWQEPRRCERTRKAAAQREVAEKAVAEYRRQNQPTAAGRSAAEYEPVAVEAATFDQDNPKGPIGR
ncbi:MAG: hypothetical protein R3C10_04050 [Pirellulales bacterium]